MIVVIDYNVGNVKSVRNALDYLDGIILPGVAAFGYAIRALGETAEAVRRFAASGRPVLGICVGFQLLFDHSCEMGRHDGLGLVAGEVRPIPPGRTIPHMGWNAVHPAEGMDLFDGIKGQEYFYFAHSFQAHVSDAENNIFGVQFHPEKSGKAGLGILRNFERICREGTNRC